MFRACARDGPVSRKGTRFDSRLYHRHISPEARRTRLVRASRAPVSGEASGNCSPQRAEVVQRLTPVGLGVDNRNRKLAAEEGAQGIWARAEDLVEEEQRKRGRLAPRSATRTDYTRVCLTGGDRPVIALAAAEHARPA